MKTLALLSVLAFVGIAAGADQSITVSKPTADTAGVVTVTLGVVNSEASFIPEQCYWYSHRANTNTFIHEGCEAFSHEFIEGTFPLSLVMNGHNVGEKHKTQRRAGISLTVQPRVTSQPWNFSQ